MGSPGDIPCAKLGTFLCFVSDQAALGIFVVRIRL